MDSSRSERLLRSLNWPGTLPLSSSPLFRLSTSSSLLAFTDYYDERYTLSPQKCYTFNISIKFHLPFEFTVGNELRKLNRKKKNELPNSFDGQYSLNEGIWLLFIGLKYNGSGVCIHVYSVCSSPTRMLGEKNSLEVFNGTRLSLGDRCYFICRPSCEVVDRAMVFCPCEKKIAWRYFFFHPVTSHRYALTWKSRVPVLFLSGERIKRRAERNGAKYNDWAIKMESLSGLTYLRFLCCGFSKCIYTILYIYSMY